MTTIHEFSAPYWVQTPLGEGRAILSIDYGIDHNGVLFVHLNDGQMKCVDTNDCRGCENPTFGIQRPVPPAFDKACDEVRRMEREADRKLKEQINFQREDFYRSQKPPTQEPK